MYVLKCGFPSVLIAGMGSVEFTLTIPMGLFFSFKGLSPTMYMGTGAAGLSNTQLNYT